MVFEVNADIGEGWADAELAPWLDSCNIACGGHTGDERTMTEALKLAAKHRMKAGAHPSWPDRVNFGRKSPPPGAISSDELRMSLGKQIADLARCAEKTGISLCHVKPHGALYHDTLRDRVIAEALADAVEQASRQLAAPLQIITMFDSALAEVCRERKIPLLREVYADRTYCKTDDGLYRLVPRGSEGALITDPAKAADQAADLVVRLPADTVCIHSDTPGAPAIAAAVARRLGTRK